jgi:coatomer subunit beta
MGAILATALAKLVLHLDELTCDSTASNILRAEACLCFYCVLESWVILTTIYNPGSVDYDLIRVGQSKLVTVPIDEDSHEHILN